MKRIHSVYVGLMFASAVGVGGIICGCASATWDVPIKETYYTRDTMEDAPTVKLPDNYSVQHFKRLRVAVNVKIEDSSGKSLLSNSFSRRLQAVFDKVKRYEVHSLHGNSVFEMEDLEDVDDSVSLAKPKEVKDIDLLLDATIKVIQNDNRKFQVVEHEFVADADFICTDLKTRSVLFSETERGVWGYTEGIRHESRSGNVNIGTGEQAMQNACLRCIRKFVNKFGNRFPVGGRIVNARAETMVMNAGRLEGVMDGQQVTVFVSEDGLDTPLAYAEAVPSDHGTSQLKVYRWNEDSKDAQSYIRELKQDPRGFVKKYKDGAKDGLFAVAYGLPPPAKPNTETK